MKTISIALLTGISAMVFSCTGTGVSSIPGTYTSNYENEYSIGSDTLIVTALNPNTFQIERRTGFQKIRNGHTQPKAYKQAHWTASYNPEKQVLQDTELGRQVYIRPQTGNLLLGDAEYRKLR